MADLDLKMKDLPKRDLVSNMKMIGDDAAAGSYTTANHQITAVEDAIANDFDYDDLNTTDQTLVGAINEVGTAMGNNKFIATLTAGNTTVTFTDNRITVNKLYDYYASNGAEPSSVTISAGEAILTYPPQLEDITITMISKTSGNSTPNIIYGFRIDNSVNHADNCVTYLEDAVGAIPAYMDFANDEFNYGSWENAFFMPRPCMLRYDGTVDYYLDPNDYTKKIDGTVSDVDDVDYPGNAMMEWGRDNRRIYYKIVPDTNNASSANIYIANYKADSDYACWSFLDVNGNVRNHFYTSIYHHYRDSDEKLRSLSGQSLVSYFEYEEGHEQGRYEGADDWLAEVQKNNPPGKDIWYGEQYCDYILITILTILITKSLNIQGKIGYGDTSYPYCTGENPIPTGLLDQKGLFYGSNTYTQIKLFGMEHFMGEFAVCFGYGVYNSKYVYKLTRSTKDGSNIVDYQFGDSDNYANYLQGPNFISQLWGGTIEAMTFTKYAFFPTTVSQNNDSKYGGDRIFTDNPILTDGVLGIRGSWNNDRTLGIFSCNIKHQEDYRKHGNYVCYTNMLSCKP